jgi:hypothetical protein
VICMLTSFWYIYLKYVFNSINHYSIGGNMFDATEDITTYELCSGIPHLSFMDKGYFIDCK